MMNHTWLKTERRCRKCNGVMTLVAVKEEDVGFRPSYPITESEAQNISEKRLSLRPISHDHYEVPQAEDAVRFFTTDE